MPEKENEKGMDLVEDLGKGAKTEEGWSGQEVKEDSEKTDEEEGSDNE